MMCLTGCGISEDCLKNTGSMRTVYVETAAFTKISVFPGIALVLKQGPEYEVRVEAGENVIDNIKVEIRDGVLVLEDETSCNLTRSYGATTVYITAPNIEEIYSNTEQEIRSDGVLTYPVLRLFSMDFFGGVGTGDFHITVNNGQLVVESNHVAAFYIGGTTQQLLVNFYDGIGRFEGNGLTARETAIMHRGSNDMVIRTTDSLNGEIFGPGNVILKTHPASVNVAEHYTGRLIYE